MIRAENQMKTVIARQTKMRVKLSPYRKIAL